VDTDWAESMTLRRASRRALRRMIELSNAAKHLWYEIAGFAKERKLAT